MRELFVGTVLIGALAGCGGPPPGSENLTFADSIQPIVEARCAKCHVDKSKGKLSLASLESAMEGGKSGAVIVPGNAKKSRLYLMVAGKVKDKKMPPKGDPLTKDQIATIKYWIDAGAH